MNPTATPVLILPIFDSQKNTGDTNRGKAVIRQNQAKQNGRLGLGLLKVMPKYHWLQWHQDQTLPDLLQSRKSSDGPTTAAIPVSWMSFQCKYVWTDSSIRRTSYCGTLDVRLKCHDQRLNAQQNEHSSSK